MVRVALGYFGGVFFNQFVSSECNNCKIKVGNFMKLGKLDYNITCYHKNPLSTDKMVYNCSSPPP